MVRLVVFLVALGFDLLPLALFGLHHLGPLSFPLLFGGVFFLLALLGVVGGLFLLVGVLAAVLLGGGHPLPRSSFEKSGVFLAFSISLACREITASSWVLP